MGSYNEEYGTAIAIRQVKYLNNVVEQDHRAVKRVTRPMLGFKSFEGNRSGYVVKTGITPPFATSDRWMEAEKGRLRHAERPHGRR